MPGLEDLYREIILDHYKNPRNRGTLEVPPAHKTEGINPLCGDEIAVYLVFHDGVVKDVKVGGQGCSISQSSASMMSSAVKGKSAADARKIVKAFKSMMGIHEAGHDEHDDADATAGIKLGDLEALRGVVKFPVRIKCATLAWNTFGQGLDDLAPAVPEGAS